MAHSAWLIWSGFAATATLNVLEFSPIVSQFAGMLFFLLWAFQNITVRQFVTELLFDIVNVFFREIVVRGVYKVDQDTTSAMVFACAPHANQFMDPLVVMRSTRRHIGFMAAKKSLRHWLVGPLCRAVDVVPVDRAQDYATKLSGSISVRTGSREARGEGTSFSKEIAAGEVLKLNLGGSSRLAVHGTVQEVVSDTLLQLKAPLVVSGSDSQYGADVPGCTKAQRHPKLSHDELWQDVVERLRGGGAVGLFPEGGSHDQSHLLPLKAGVALAALTTQRQYPNLKVLVVPVGLNYYSGHRFRSRVYVDFGDPVEVSTLTLAVDGAAEDDETEISLTEAFGRGGDLKRRACSSLMGTVRSALETVTVQAPDRHTLELFWMLRRLYVPRGMTKGLTLDEKTALSRGFAAGYERVKDEPRVQRVMEHVADYNKALKQWGIKDHEVAVVGNQSHRTVVTISYTLWLLLKRLVLLVFFAAVAVPGLTLASPCILLTRSFSHYKSRLALKRSNVKVHGHDVVGTWKVLVAMMVIPIMHITYTYTAYAWYGDKGAIIYFFCMPLVSYSSILAQDRLRGIFRSLWPLVASLVVRNRGRTLEAMRSELVQEVKETVENHGWHSHVARHASYGSLSDLLSPKIHHKKKA